MKNVKILLFVLCSFPLFAAVDKGFFYKAQIEYDKGNIEEAISIYNENEYKLFNSKELFYNMGNFYYRIGEKEKSLLNLKKAKSLDPSSPEINYNYDYVRKDLKLPILKTGIKEKFLLHTVLGPFELAISTSLLAFFVFILLVIGIFKKNGIITKANFLLIPITLYFLVITGIRSFNSQDIGIVISDNVNVYSGPSKNNAVLFKVEKGGQFSIKKTLENSNENWFKIKLENSKVGWIIKDGVYSI